MNPSIHSLGSTMATQTINGKNGVIFSCVNAAGTVMMGAKTSLSIASHQGGVRDYNEDGVFIAPGFRTSEYNTLDLVNALQRANQAVYNAIKDPTLGSDGRQAGGSTAVLSNYDPADCVLNVIGVGDSMGYLVFYDEKTKRHEKLPLIDRQEKADGVLWNMLGYPNPDYNNHRTYQISSFAESKARTWGTSLKTMHCFYVGTTDGLDYFDIDRLIAEAITKKISPAEHIINTCKQNSGDNITVVVDELNTTPNPKLPARLHEIIDGNGWRYGMECATEALLHTSSAVSELRFEKGLSELNYHQSHIQSAATKDHFEVEILQPYTVEKQQPREVETEQRHSRAELKKAGKALRQEFGQSSQKEYSFNDVHRQIRGIQSVFSEYTVNYIHKVGNEGQILGAVINLRSPEDATNLCKAYQKAGVSAAVQKNDPSSIYVYGKLDLILEKTPLAAAIAEGTLKSTSVVDVVKWPFEKAAGIAGWAANKTGVAAVARWTVGKAGDVAGWAAQITGVDHAIESVQSRREHRYDQAKSDGVDLEKQYGAHGKKYYDTDARKQVQGIANALPREWASGCSLVEGTKNKNVLGVAIFANSAENTAMLRAAYAEMGFQTVIPKKHPDQVWVYSNNLNQVLTKTPEALELVKNAKEISTALKDPVEGEHTRHMGIRENAVHKAGEKSAAQHHR